MKDIEKLFEEKLKNHQVVPPTRAWNQLEQKLQGRPLFSLYWKIAASVLLFISVLGAVLLYHHTDKVTKPTANISEQEKTPEIAQKADREPIRNDPEQTRIPEPVERVETSHLHGGTSNAKKDALKGRDFQQEPLVSSASPTEDFQKEVRKVEPRAIQLLSVTEQQAALSDLRITHVAKDASSEAVTITYRASGITEKNESAEKTFAFLDQIKSASLSLAELRQAKDAFITKAFSSKEKSATR